jgi:hypothetical protein
VSFLKKRLLRSLHVAEEMARSWKMLLVVLFLAWAFLPIAGPMARADDTGILLLHTDSVKGHLFPCPT